MPEASASRQSSLLDASSPLPYLNAGASPLLTPGGKSLGRGLDDSPAISSASTARHSMDAADLVRLSLPAHVAFLLLEACYAQSCWLCLS